MSRFLHASLAALTPYVPGEQPKTAGLIKLNTNEAPFDPPPAVTQAVQSASARLRLYPDPESTALREAIGEKLGVPRESLLMTNGSDELLYYAFLAYARNGVAFPDVTYGFYQVLADLLDCPTRILPLKQDLTVDADAFRETASMAVITNPNAPTGLSLPLRQIERIVRSAPDRLVLIDEAYVDFGGESAVGLTRKYDNLIVARTFSKSRALAGGRLGFGVANEALIRELTAIKNAINPYNVNALTQAAGLACLAEDAYFTEACAAMAALRDQTADTLRAMGCAVTESKANFLFVEAPGVPGETLFRRLREQNILTRYFDQPRTKDRIRVTVGTPEQMDLFIKEVGRIMEEAK